MQPLNLINMSPAKSFKAQYSEAEAAQILSISVEELRSLVKDHIVKEDDAGNGAVTVFQSADLLVLRILAGLSVHATAAG